MNSLLETGVITELLCGSNFAYLLEDNNQFLLTEYKVLQSQRNNEFIKCMKMLYNGKVELYYLTAGYKPFSALIPSLDADSFMTITTNLIKCINDVKANGFLSCQNLDISFDKIFVELNTLKPSLIYIPISKRVFSDNSYFENELRTNLVKLINNTLNISTGKSIQFASELLDGTLSLEDLYNRIKGIKATVKNMQTASRETVGSAGKLRMIAMNSPERLELDIDKSEYVIGKNTTNVDGTIAFNKAISRIHCKISRNGSQHWITDLTSANGTFVNKVRLQPNEPRLVANGDIVRLANSDFQICIG